MDVQENIAFMETETEIDTVEPNITGNNENEINSSEPNIAGNSETDSLEPNIAEKVQPQRIFGGKKKKGAYFVTERLKVAQMIDKHKKEYEKEKKSGKLYFNEKKNKWQTEMPSQGFLSKAIREYYTNLKDMKSTEKLFRNAYDMGRRAYDDFLNGKLKPEDILSSKMLRLPGGGCKVQVPELRQELFQWFIDIR